MAKIHELIKLTMDRYGVRGTELSKIAGISTNHISQFRNGKAWLTEDTFENMLEAMDHLSPGSKKYFCELLANQHISRMDNKQLLIDLIENADADTVEAALLAIGRKWSKESKNSTKTDAIAV